MTSSNGNIFRVTGQAGDLRLHYAHYDITVMQQIYRSPVFSSHKEPVMRKAFPRHDVVIRILAAQSYSQSW